MLPQVDAQPKPGRPRRRWGALLARIARLTLRRRSRTAELVRDSYDRIAAGYDEAWTTHMRDLSLEMLDRLDPPPGSRCIDLSCGTGFITAELARRTGSRPVGVDASAGMLDAAAEARGDCCDFVGGDMLAHLRGRPAGSADVITVGWGLGYSRPGAVIGEAARVLAPGGRIGVIDNSLFSLAGVLWASMGAFAEHPAALAHVSKVRFVAHQSVLAALMRARGLGVPWQWGGSRSYRVADGRAVIDRLTATGAAAGFEFAARADDREAVFARFAEIMEQRRPEADGVAVTHRYIAAVGVKPCSR